MRISSLFSLVGSAISIAAATPIHDLVEPRSPIIGGTPAKLGSVPFMVSIRDSEGQHVCGGSLISSTAVLTALHCLENEYNLRGVSVLAGTIDNTTGGVVRKIRRILKYPKDRRVDVMILELSEPIPTTDTIKYAKLGSQPAAGERVKTVGWGLSGFVNKEPTYSSKLMDISAEVNMSNACEQFRRLLMSRERYHETFINSPMLFCATFGRGIEGPCPGDSGGPLINRQGQLVGILSMGDGFCESKNSPRMYTSVDPLSAWIRGITGT